MALADGRVRYVAAWGKWIVYEDGCWVDDHRDVVVTERAREMARKLRRLAATTEGEAGPNANRASMHLPCTRHACGDCRENKDTLKAFAENQDSDIQACDRWTGVRPGRVGCP